MEAFLKRLLTFPVNSQAEGIPAAINDRAMRTVQEHLRWPWQRFGNGVGIRDGLGAAEQCTEYVDHHRRARSSDHRLDAAWFGSGTALKQKALDEALKLVA